MKNSTRAVIATILTTACLSAFAEDSGFYAGVEVGNAGYVSGAGSKNSTAYGIMAGYQINKSLGVEAQYTNLGNYSGVSTTGATAGKPYSSQSDTTTLVAIGKYPVADIFSVYAKLGAANTNNNQNHSNGTSGNTSRISATYGLGVQYEINSTVGVRFGWDRVIVDSHSTTTNLNASRNMDIWALSALYKF